MKVLVTGSAGFIGMHVAERLLARGDEVVGLDNMNDYYDPALKRARLARLVERKGYTHVHADLSDRGAIEALVDKVLAANPDSVAAIKAGKLTARKFLVGQVMKESKGKAAPDLVNQIIEEKTQ